MTRDQIIRWVLKPCAFIGALLPVCLLAWAAATGNLSVNPLSDITNATGDWTLRFLCIALAVTPLRRLTGWNDVIKFRRMLGLFAFFYGALHFLTYVVFDRFAGLDVHGRIVSLSTVRELAVAVVADIYKRPFITAGFTALILMVPLAATSTAGVIRRIGGKRWQALHRLMYISCAAATIHYWWLVRADIRRPLAYATIVAVLLLSRLYWSRARLRLAQLARISSPARELKKA